MSVLARVNWMSQQRVDLQHMVAEQSFAAHDFRLFSYILSGLTQNYVIKGLEIVSRNALKITISTRSAVIICPTSNATSFYVSGADEADYEMTLPSSSTLFIEAYFERTTSAPVATAQWDPGAVTEQTPAGAEFTSSLDFQEYVELKFRYSTSGFTANGIKVAKVVSGPSSVTTITDSRDMFYRLATGGSVPDYANRYPWSTSRGEALIDGDASKLGQLTVENPYYYQDGIGARNDKALTSMKEWMDAVMTALLEIKGTPFWYSVGSSFTSQILYFDNINGSAPVPKGDLGLEWDNTGGSESIYAVGTDGPLEWASAYGNFKWYLGGSFDTATTPPYLSWVTDTRDFSSKLFSVDLSLAPSTSAVFLKLDRETVPGAVNDQEVTWGDGGDIGIYPEAQCVHGVAQDFTGIAVGDYVRRVTDGYMSYHKVIGLTIDNSNVETHIGAVATPSVIGLVLESPLPSPSIEKFKWFRANYDSKDLYFTSPTDSTRLQNEDAVQISALNTDLYLIGRREGDQFYWRDLSQYLHVSRLDNDTIVKHTLTVRETVQVGEEVIPSPEDVDVNRFRGNIAVTGDVVARGCLDFEHLFGDRAIVSSGYTGIAATTQMTYFSISTLGNDSSFGQLDSSGYIGSAAITNNVRMLIAGDSNTNSNIIKAVNFASRANASSFGTLSSQRNELAGASSVLRGVFIGGKNSGGIAQNTIDYVNIASLSNADSFGSLTAAKYGIAAASNGSWAVVAGGNNGTANLNAIEYFPIHSGGNGMSFGTLAVAKTSLASVSNGTRAVFGGGRTTVAVDTMEYVTISTKANASTFGTLSVARQGLAGVSDGERGVFIGGQESLAYSTVLDYISVKSTGNATSFGNLSVARSKISAASGD